MKKLNKRDWLNLLVGLVIGALIIIFKPLDLTLKQAALLAILLNGIYWWTIEIWSKEITSILLILGFLFFGDTPVKVVFSFPLSTTFLYIVLTYVFSSIIVRSGLVKKFLYPLLNKFCTTPLKTLLTIFFVFILMIPIIPQPLARLIMVITIFKDYLEKAGVRKPVLEVLLFGAAISYTLVNMSVMDADIIMNRSAVAFGDLPMTNLKWMQYMAPPFILYAALSLALFAWVFRDHLLTKDTLAHVAVPQQPLTRKQKLSLVVTILTVLLWLTEPLHGMPSLYVLIGALVVFAISRSVTMVDIKSIDIKTLLFLTAVFPIGQILKHSGVADKVFSTLESILPYGSTNGIMLTIVVISMLMHLLLGSNTATLSVVIPGLLVIFADKLPAEIIFFTAYISVAFHAILPFHSVTYAICDAKNYYPSKLVRKYGLWLTILVFLGVFLIFAPWWRLTGLL